MMGNLPWIQKYQPKTAKDIHGNREALEKIRRGILAKQPLLVYGPIGSGKTSSVLALARDFDYEILEVNASDSRNKEQIETIVGSSLQQQSLFHRGKIILVDEVDGIAGNHDRGGLPTLQKLLEEAKQAVVLTANDPWDSKFSTLRKKTQLIEFKRPDTLTVISVLQSLCRQENIAVQESVLKHLARRSDGDIRAAINDLQQIGEGKTAITEEDLASLGDRKREQTIQQALQLIFKSKQTTDVLEAFEHVDMELDEIFLWIDENLPKEYQREDLMRAYRMLSTADIFKRRITRWQHWRFLVYIYAFLTAGIALAKREKHPGFVQYQRTTRLLKIWMANQKKAKQKALAEKLGDELHGSTKRIVKEIIPYVRLMLKYNKKETFGLNKEEVQWMIK
ncbi:MAG: replication factor C large subunit [Nanoarchaeota archaeon]